MLSGLVPWGALLVVQPVAFDPGFPEWFTFILTIMIIVLSYLIKYRFSSRKKHQYIHHTNPGDPNDSVLPADNNGS